MIPSAMIYLTALVVLSGVLVGLILFRRRARRAAPSDQPKSPAILDANSNKVWCAHLFADDAAFIPFIAADTPARPRKTYMSTATKNRYGRRLSQADFPQALWAIDDVPPTLQDYCYTSGHFPLVSPRLAEAMKVLDLGEGAFFPTRFFGADGAQELRVKHLFWNFGNQKATFCAEQSNVKRVTAGKGREIPEMYVLRDQFSDGDVSLTQAALKGPDIWAEPLFPDYMFFSDRFVQCVVHAGFANLFAFKPVRIVDAG